jgi:hypothetical protein
MAKQGAKRGVSRVPRCVLEESPEIKASETMNSINQAQRRDKTRYEVPLENVWDRLTFVIAQWHHKPKPKNGMHDDDIC